MNDIKDEVELVNYDFDWGLGEESSTFISTTMAFCKLIEVCTCFCKAVHCTLRVILRVRPASSANNKS